MVAINGSILAYILALRHSSVTLTSQKAALATNECWAADKPCDILTQALGNCSFETGSDLSSCECGATHLYSPKCVLCLNSTDPTLVPVFQQAMDGCVGKNGTGATSDAAPPPRISISFGLVALVIGLMGIGAGL